MYILCITTIIAFKFCAIQLFSCYSDILIQLFIHASTIHSSYIITDFDNSNCMQVHVVFERYDLRGSIKDAWRSVGHVHSALEVKIAAQQDQFNRFPIPQRLQNWSSTCTSGQQLVLVDSQCHASCGCFDRMCPSNFRTAVRSQS